MIQPTAVPYAARLAAYTKPVIEGMETPYELVAYCARVSNPGNQLNHETAPKLIEYLKRMAHWSPLDMCDAVIEIDTTRDIARQMLRHGSAKFQEFSQRYADAATELGFVPPRECRLQDETNRQNSLPCMDMELTAWWFETQMKHINMAGEDYAEAIRRGIAKECARVILPEGLIASRLYMKGSLRTWIHYLDVREHESTQKEHRVIAHIIAKIIADVWHRKD